MSLNKVQDNTFRVANNDPVPVITTYSDSKINARVKNMKLLKECDIRGAIAAAPVRGQRLSVAADNVTLIWANQNNVLNARGLERAQFALENLQDGGAPPSLNLSSTTPKQLRMALVANIPDPTNPAGERIVVVDDAGNQNDRCIRLFKKGFYLLICRFTLRDQFINGVVEFKTQTSIGPAGTFVNSLGRACSVKTNSGTRLSDQTVTYYFPVNTQLYDDYVNVKLLAVQLVSGKESLFVPAQSFVTILRLA